MPCPHNHIIQDCPCPKDCPQSHSLLRPKDEHNRQLLEDFIAGLITTQSAKTIANVIPQKGTYVEVGNRVLIGLVRPSQRRGYNEAFEKSEAELYYTGPHFPTTVSLHDLHFFMPYTKGKGIRDVYEIVKVRTITSREAHQVESDPNDDMRLAFAIRFHHRQFEDYKMVDNHQFIDNTFIDTTFEELTKILLCPTV